MNARMLYRAEKMGFKKVSSADDSAKVVLEL
jgi:hypothetical protein